MTISKALKSLLVRISYVKRLVPSPTSMTSIYSLLLKNWVSFVGPPNANTTNRFQVGHHTCINIWKAFSALSRFEQNKQ